MRLIIKGEQALFNLEIKKRVDQALIPIPTIQKFPALVRETKTLISNFYLIRQRFPSLHGGSLEITLTVPLTADKKETDKYDLQTVYKF